MPQAFESFLLSRQIPQTFFSARLYLQALADAGGLLEYCRCPLPSVPPLLGCGLLNFGFATFATVLNFGFHPHFGKNVLPLFFHFLTCKMWQIIGCHLQGGCNVQIVN